MGITDEKLIAEKIAILEGMWSDEQNGDSIGVSMLHSFPSGVVVGSLLVGIGG